jgi:hypothetical protein
MAQVRRAQSTHQQLPRRMQARSGPTYNEAGLLEKVEARVRRGGAWTTFVDDIDRCQGSARKSFMANGPPTTYTYDPGDVPARGYSYTVRPNDAAGPQNLIKDGRSSRTRLCVRDPVGTSPRSATARSERCSSTNDVVTLNTQYVY